MLKFDGPVVAVVVAAGSGSRLGAALPKALVEVGGKSLVRRSVEAFVEVGIDRLIVTIPHGLETAFEAVLAGVEAEIRLTVGGETRQESVRLALNEIDAPNSSIVLVHDAARALVPAAMIERVVQAVSDGAAAVIPVVPVIDSIREVSGSGSRIVERDVLRAVQTPQGARLEQLRAAHERVAADRVIVTDDAAVCEYDGHQVSLVAGDPAAFKITEPRDLLLAAALLTEGVRP